MGRITVLMGAALIALTAGCHAEKPGGAPVFDSARSYDQLLHQMEPGSRVPGTDAHREIRDWLAGELRDAGGVTAIQDFAGIIDGREVLMTNIVASFYPKKADRVLLCAHWDCRPWADRDPVPARRAEPVPGANDGASGVAVLLEIARAVAAAEPAVGVDIAFFDGEDAGGYGEDDTWCLGSRHFARVMPRDYRPRFAVLLDMIGDSELSLTRDANSMRAAPGTWDQVTRLCAVHGIPIEPGLTAVMDDHLPLIERGIPAVDLIDFDYAWWHTTADTADKCSAESLGRIGAVVLDLVYGER